MIDILNALITAIKNGVKTAWPGIYITGELSENGVSRFPCILVEEIDNTDTEVDNSPSATQAFVQYRVTVYSNKDSGRISEARALASDIDDVMQRLNFRKRSFLGQSGLYNNSAYKIEVTYSAAADVNGVIYLRR